MKSIFITATDTEVGKTFVSCGIVRILNEQGINVGVMKPLSSGNAEDARLLKAAAGVTDPIDLINPVRLKHPLAPLVSSRRERTKISLNRIVKSFKELEQLHDIVLVEGIGGIMVPIMNNFYVSDLIKLLKLPIIIVTRPNLGTINHTLLTVNYAKKQNIRIKGIVINYHSNFKKTLAEKTNPAVIRELSGISVIEIPYSKSSFPAKCFRNLVKKLL